MGAAPSPWVLHVSVPEELLQWVPHLSAVGRRLVSKSVPGPVAYEIKLDSHTENEARQRLGNAADETIHNGFLTLRCPEFTPTQEVLSAVKAPVAIIGAGTPTQPGVFDLQDLPANLLANNTAIAAAMDGGPTRYRRSSTLVRIEGGNYTILRPGVIDERILHRLAHELAQIGVSRPTDGMVESVSLDLTRLGDREARNRLPIAGQHFHTD